MMNPMMGFEIAAAEAERKLEDMYRRKTEGEERYKGEGDNIIPRHFTLKSKRNHNYLRYITKDSDDEIGGCLRFSGDRMISPYTKFEVDYSTVKKEYAHIRSCYNHKFWVRQSSHSNFIFADANEVEEDVSKWNCTLFEVIYNKKEKAYSFRHVQLKSLLYLNNSHDPYANCLVAKSGHQNEAYAHFTVTDWDSIFILPRHVAFKGDNGDYLKYISPYLQFSASNYNDSSAGHEIFPTKDGNIHIKNDDSGKFWYFDPNWIKATSSKADDNNRNTLFWPFKLDNRTVALRCLGNDRFITRTTWDGKSNCLNSNGRGIVGEARMEVEEIAISRIIDNVNYRLSDARIRDAKVLSMAKGDAINKTDEADTVTFKCSYEDKTKRTWTSCVSAKAGFSVKFDAGIPMVGKGQIEVSAELGEKHEWGETHKNKKLTEFSYPVTVPPMTRVKINAVVTQGMCEVPFSYRRTDILKNGRRVVHHLHDGLFTGVNSFDFEFRSEQIPMEDY